MVYPLVCCWALLSDFVLGFRADEPVQDEWLPNLDAAARAGCLPAGDHGFLVHDEGAAMRVFVPLSEVEPTLALLAEAARTHGLELKGV